MLSFYDKLLHFLYGTYDDQLKQLFATLSARDIDYSREAKEYLAQITTPIRIFSVDGPGYGDQVFPLQIIRRLREMGFRGQIEWISNNVSKKRYKLYGNHKDTPKVLDRELGGLPLVKIGHLLDVEITKDTCVNLTFNSIDTGAIKLIDWHSFKKSNPAEVKLAIFAAPNSLVENNYGVLRRHLFPSNSANALSHSQEVLLLNPFTGVPKGLDPGFMIQRQNQSFKKYFNEKILSYKLAPTSQQAIANALERIAIQPSLHHMVSRLLTEKIDSFAIYGLNVAYQPLQRYILPNFIAAAEKMQQKINNSLIVFTLDKLEEKTWDTLLSHFNTSKIQFLDVTKPTTPLLPMQLNNSLYVVRLPTLSYTLFNQLIQISTFPPLYQGAMTEAVLRNAGKYGLYCFSSQVPVIDSGLPLDLKNSGICASRLKNTVSKILPLLEKYRNMPQPKNLEFERLEVALTTLKKTPGCDETPNTQCLFFSSKGFPHVMPLAQEMAWRGAGYGISGAALKHILKHAGLDPQLASSCSHLISVNMQLFFEKKEFDEFNFLFFMPLFLLEFVTNIQGVTPPKAAQIIKMATPLFILLYTLVLQVPDFDLENSLIVLLLTACSLASHVVTYQLTDKLIETITPAAVKKHTL